MPKLKIALLGAGLSLGAMTVAQAAPVLGLRAGLWQSTAQVQLSMDPSAMADGDLASLPPAQRAQMAQMMSQMAETSHPPIVTKSCITAKDLENVESFAPENRPDCKQTILKRTANEIDAKVVCTGKDPANMMGSFKSSSPEAFNGTLKGTVSEEGHTIPITDTIEGKWLGADCGDVKPVDHEQAKTQAKPN